MLSSMTKGEIVDEIVIDANIVFDVIAVAEDVDNPRLTCAWKS